MSIIGPAGLYSRRRRVGLRESRSALDAQIVFERPYIAHSSLPIYGSDTHLHACSIAEILAADIYIKQKKTHTPTERFSVRANNNNKKKNLYENIRRYESTDSLVAGLALRGLHRQKSSRPLRQLRIDG